MTKILFIEDDEWLGDLYADVFAAAHFDVVRTQHAVEALELLASHNIAAIVLDIMLPDLNGIALLQELRSYPTVSTIPILVHSAIDVQHAALPKEVWQAYGVHSFLPKGETRPHELVRMVKRALNS